jgi:hypothetical protein
LTFTAVTPREAKRSTSAAPRRVAEYAEAAEEALESPDAWAGFCAYVERICAMQAADRSLKGVLTRTFPNAKALERHRSRGYELSIRLIDRAKSEGSLRPDFVPEDLVLLLMANAGVVEAAGQDAPEAWRRFVGLMLDAFREDQAGPLPPAPTPRQMIRAMRRLGTSSKTQNRSPSPRWCGHSGAVMSPPLWLSRFA